MRRLVAAMVVVVLAAAWPLAVLARPGGRFGCDMSCCRNAAAGAGMCHHGQPNGCTCTLKAPAPAEAAVVVLPALVAPHAVLPAPVCRSQTPAAASAAVAAGFVPLPFHPPRG